MKTKNLLLIDDDQDVLDLLSAAFEEASFKVQIHTEIDGHSAIAYLESNQPKPDLILLDWKMPQMTGRECLELIKTHPIWQNIPTLIFSSSNHPQDIAEAYKLHTNAYLQKPFGFDALVKLVLTTGKFWLESATPYKQ
jgi:chemotaxis family two-component system response regulator Rcp1